MRIFSFGGGVQSTAALVLAAKGKLSYDHFIFANVGDDSENPDTLAYIREHSAPYAKNAGISLIEVRRVEKSGEIYTLKQYLERDTTTIPIPMRMPNGAPGNRACTQRFKIRVIAQWLKRNGANKKNPATVGIGISVDEIHRMRESGVQMRKNEWPLIDMRLTRGDCLEIIKSANLPPPPKSACFFCPYTKIAEWSKMKKNRPDLFQEAVRMEKMLNERRESLGKDKIWLTRYNKPLEEALQERDPEIDLDVCETGYCMT